MKLDTLLYESDDGDLYTGALELMGTWEVARYLGIEKSRIARWLTHGAIVAPVARLKSGPFWTLPQVRDKAREMYKTERGSKPNNEELDAWLVGRRERKQVAAA